MAKGDVNLYQEALELNTEMEVQIKFELFEFKIIGTREETRVAGDAWYICLL